MKFVTVMDMWLLIMNMLLMGGLFYFGRRLLKTVTRLLHVGESRQESAERRRCIAIIQEELDQHRAWGSMNNEPEAKVVVSVLEDILQSIRGTSRK